MSGTLTVPTVALEAVQRGEESLMDWIQLLEVGTDEQIDAEICWRAAMVKADVEKRRVLAPAIELTALQLAMCALRSK